MGNFTLFIDTDKETSGVDFNVLEHMFFCKCGFNLKHSSYSDLNKSNLSSFSTEGQSHFSSLLTDLQQLILDVVSMVSAELLKLLKTRSCCSEQSESLFWGSSCAAAAAPSWLCLLCLNWIQWETEN